MTIAPILDRINSYPKVYAIGHKVIDGIFDNDVFIEEKIDGSQFSFGILDGELMCRSKGKQLILDVPEKMFLRAVEIVKELEPLLHPGWIYRCEYLQKPKHNTLAYDRVPAKHLIVFDISTGIESYLTVGEKFIEAKRLGLECVPLMYAGPVASFAMFAELLEQTSILGGTLVEGIVVKNYELITREKKIAIGKYVSERFKEIHDKGWRKKNPTQGDLVQEIIDKHRTPARWNKAVQHLKERGELTHSPKDIGPLMKEVSVDTLEECKEEIMEFLFKKFWKKIQRGITGGLPEWYKEELAKSAFEEGEISTPPKNGIN